MSTLLTALKTRLPIEATLGRTFGHMIAIRAWMSSERAAKLAFFAATGLVSAYLIVLIGADHGLAQTSVGSEYQGDAVHQTLENIRNYIISALLLLGGIGFSVGLGVKAIAGTNENMHHASHLAMKGGALAVIGSAIVIPLMEIAQGIAAGGSGDGGGG